jgi:hypothetical protein
VALGVVGELDNPIEDQAFITAVSDVADQIIGNSGDN